ncbi:gluconeogenesis factor YvcK family protein [Paraclostridium bifermentans]|uniref:gluconeogenesis factor YvcK family protein n=1 Tax=Paraclostridium bifermentans TaxID=1490 RepID=UPI00290CC07E|nr:gluconeogenesis factor YvcK family protein [Paraclostridium bifermentans]MDU3335702.1 YvcK family protein [Paraclostridium bifermentans]
MTSVIIFIGLVGWIFSISVAFLYLKEKKENSNKTIKNNIKEEKPRVVVIGGGTGQSVFLRGLKHYTPNITAVVTVADDGGGSGVLREDLGMLPPGDIRNCLLSLANMEPTMDAVMKYRFTDGALKGQSFGNLFLAAMNGVYGNFETAVYKMSEVFAITGRVLPVTLEDINLIANLDNGNIVRGESNIPNQVRSQNTKIKSIELEPKNAKPLDEVIKSIKNTDIIVIGPGSLYTSIMPNLLVDGVIDAIKESEAPKVYISNIMTQPGETDNFNVVDHINAINKHCGENIIDIVITNNEVLPKPVFEIYNKDGASQVLLDKKQKQTLEDMGIKVVECNLVEIKSNYIRHDADYISNVVVNLALSHIYDNEK